jgi:predicted nucleic acid-binding protein
MVREVFNHHYRQLAISSITVGELVYLVSNNTKEFERVNGLRLENWVVLQ